MNAASDVYTYGVVLWEFASGHLPYHDETDDQVVISFIKDGERNHPNRLSHGL